jgi:hypothetical protein
MRTKQGSVAKYHLFYNYEPENENRPHHYKVVDNKCTVVTEFRTKKTVLACTLNGAFKFRNLNFVFKRGHATEIKKAQESGNKKRYQELVTIVLPASGLNCPTLFS